jgi:hypothetical protein
MALSQPTPACWRRQATDRVDVNSYELLASTPGPVLDERFGLGGQPVPFHSLAKARVWV